MKQQKINWRKHINPLLLLLFCGIIFFILNYNARTKAKARIKEFEENGLYTIGTITKYNEEHINTNIRVAANVEYGYTINGKYYEYLDEDFPKNNIPKIGETYMIIYLPYEPDRSGLLCDYRVRDSTDFKRYIEEFKRNRPKLYR